MKVLVVINSKGGVGKTTCTINLASEFQSAGYKTLLIDLDSQRDLTNFFLGDDSNNEVNIQGVLENSYSIKEALVNVAGKENLMVVPGSSTIDTSFRLKNSQRALHDRLKECADVAEIVLIDCPSSLNEAVYCGLYAAHYALLVSEAETPSINNLARALETVENVAKDSPNDLRTIGILINKVDKRRNITARNVDRLTEGYPALMLESYIPVDSSIVNSYEGKWLLRENKFRSRSVSSFMYAAGEIFERMGGDVSRD